MVKASMLKDEISADVFVAAVQQICAKYSEQELRITFRMLAGDSADGRISSTVMHDHLKHRPRKIAPGPGDKPLFLGEQTVVAAACFDADISSVAGMMKASPLASKVMPPSASTLSSTPSNPPSVLPSSTDTVASDVQLLHDLGGASSSSTPPFLNDEEMKVVTVAYGHLYSILGEVRRHVESTKQTASTFRADSVKASILRDEISIDILVAAVQKMPELCYMGFQDPDLLYSEQELRLGFRTMVGISAGDRISSAVLHYHHEPVDTLNTFKEYSIDFAGTK